MASTVNQTLKEDGSSSPYFPTNYSWVLWAILVTFLVTRLSIGTKHTRLTGAPIVGKKWRFEPSILTKYRFVFGAWPIVREGWRKHHDSAFTILRPDSNVTVLPQKYVRELQSLPDGILHPIQALSDDMLGTYTGMKILVGSHLSYNVIRNKLTPRLGVTIPVIEDEIQYGFARDVPNCQDDWVEIDLTQVITRVVSRITSRTWIGLPLCRNEDWHSTNLATTEQIFFTALIMRNFPTFMHPILGYILPTRRKLRRGLKKVHSFLVPVIEERRRREEQEPQYSKPDDVLQWMMDLAEGEEREAENLATRYVFSVIGSLYTVSAGVVDCLYDMTERPEYQELLREEAIEVLREDGGWKKGTPTKLEKMDSFMKESQRINAPSPSKSKTTHSSPAWDFHGLKLIQYAHEVSFKRIVREPITLSDGLKLPKGAYISVVNTSHFQLEEGFENAEGDSRTFDGLRYYRKHSDPAFKSRFQYASTDKDHITFGHGRFACPGRFVASVEMKMILVHILLKYDLKFAGEKTVRPKNLQVLELGFQNPAARFQVRERKV